MRYVSWTIVSIVLSLSLTVEAKTMNEAQQADQLSVEELRKANYIATLTLRGGSSIFDGKELDAYLLMARSVFESAMAAADNTDSTEDRDGYKTVAFMTAYNIASNTWPGWNEREIAPESQALGRRFAQINREMVDSMGLTRIRPGGLWISGAHELAAENYDAARDFFLQAKHLGEESDNEESALMNQGWVMVVDILLQKKSVGPELKALQQQLSDMSDDGKFYAAQYDEALKVFTAD